MAKLTLYRHFGSKSELLAEALEQRHECRHSELVSLLDEADDWRAGVLAVFDWLRAWHEEPDFRGCAFVQAMVEVGDREPRVRAVVVRHKARSTRALRDHLYAAGFAEPEEIAGQLQVLIDGATALARIDGDAVHAERARRAAEALVDRAERRA